MVASGHGKSPKPTIFPVCWKNHKNNQQRKINISNTIFAEKRATKSFFTKGREVRFLATYQTWYFESFKMGPFFVFRNFGFS